MRSQAYDQVTVKNFIWYKSSSHSQGKLEKTCRGGGGGDGGIPHWPSKGKAFESSNVKEIMILEPIYLDHRVN